MTIRLPSYLHRNRCGIYGFRIVIPQAIRVCFKSNEYRVTLFTAEKRRAKQLAFGLTNFVHAHFDSIRRKKMSGCNTPLEESFLENLEAERNRLLTAFQEVLETDEAIAALSVLIYQSNQPLFERIMSLSMRRQQLSPSTELDTYIADTISAVDSLGLTLSVAPDESISSVDAIDTEQ